MLKKLFILFALLTSLLNANSLKNFLLNIEKNENYQAQLDIQEMAKKTYDSASDEHFPKIAFVGAYEKNSNLPKNQAEEILSGQVIASYILYDGGRISKDELAKKSLFEAEKFKSKYLKQELMLNLIKEYFSYQNNKYAIEALKYKINELEEEIKKINILLENDLTTKDKLQALIAAKKLALYNVETLNLALEKSLLQIYLISNLNSLPKDDESLIEPRYKEENRADIEAKKYELESVKYQAEKFNYLPRISINNALQKNKFINFDLIDDSKLNNKLSFQLEVPLFDFGKISKDKESAKLKTLAINKQIEYQKKALQVQRSLALKALESSKSKLNSALASMEATNTAYEFTKKRFTSNLLSYTEYLNELTKQQEAKYRVKEAQNDIEVRKAELAFFLGIDLLSLVKD